MHHAPVEIKWSYQKPRGTPLLLVVLCILSQLCAPGKPYCQRALPELYNLHLSVLTQLFKCICAELPESVRRCVCVSFVCLFSLGGEVYTDQRRIDAVV